MPIIKSAKKRVRVSERKAQFNQLQRMGAKTAVRSATRSIGTTDAAADVVRAAASRLDRAASKGSIHKNKAARLKSRLAARLKAAATVVAAKPKAESKAKTKAKAVKKTK
jgi:small subunit ribosomal protein S20